MIDCVDDVWVGREEAVGFDLLHGQCDALLAKRTSDLLEGVEGAVAGGGLDEVDVGEALVYSVSMCFLVAPGDVQWYLLRRVIAVS